jgi:beta-glucosidase
MKYKTIIDQMTLSEKVAFCSGAAFFSTRAFEKYGIPGLTMADGPHGIRKVTDAGTNPGARQTVPATCFPPACTNACSWDRDLLQEMGEAIGEEALQEGVSIVLGPGVNIKRNPLCGRNFEYFSEDPFLAGEMAKAWINGVQRLGVGVSLKHFAANNQENYRTSSDSILDQRTLREIYLPGFEKAVMEAKPATVMCAYNKLNGTFCSDNNFLLRQILRDEWGFEGVVISDWGAVNDRIEAFRAGLDLEMPSSGGFFDRDVIEAVKNGALSEERINESVDRLLTLVFSASEKLKPNFRYDAEMHHRLAQKIAASSAVLLKNQDAILPIDRKCKLALIGTLARELRFQGAGSSWINPTRLSNVIEGFESLGLDYTYYPGYPLKGEENGNWSKEAVEGAAKCEVAVVFAGLPPIYESEGFDRSDMRLPPEQNNLIERVADVNPHTVVVLTVGSPVEMPWLGKVKAVLNMYLPGQAGGLAAAELLTGMVNPSGKLAESYPHTYSEIPSAGLYEAGERQAQYREGIYVGYRYYDKAGKEVDFPFGHGLSYTAFEYSDLNLSRKVISEDEGLIVSMAVKNTGKMGSAEVVQLYVSDLDHKVFRPEKELKGFAKVFLKPGEKQRVDFRLDARSFAFYDVTNGGWVVPDGKYQISIGASSRDIRLTDKIAVHGKQFQQDRTGQPDWYSSPAGKPTQSDFEKLLGHSIEPQQKPQRGEYTLSSSLRDMQNSLVIRIMHKSMERTVARGFGGADYTNVNFKGIMETIVTNPLKSLVMSSSGNFSLNTAQGLVDMANGRFLRGLITLIKKSK